MSATDPGLPDAAQRVREAYAIHGTGDCTDGPTLDDGPEAWYSHIVTEEARAARADVPDLIRQAKADALDDLAETMRGSGWSNVDDWGVPVIYASALDVAAAAIREGRKS